MINGTRQRNLFSPTSSEPFKLSRSKIELFIDCARCFYLDRRLGVGRPSMPAFTLNNAVDTLFKKEFDIHRVAKSQHPIMEKYGVDAVPFEHHDLGIWRENFKGVQFHHKPTNFIITGAIDDVWINPGGELIIVDYKATSTENEISMDSEYRQAYKRQMEIYQWLFRKNGFKVSDTGYFVYANGKTDRKAFDKKLEFDVQLFIHIGTDKWVEPKIIEAHAALVSETVPKAKETCEHCNYRISAGIALKDKMQKKVEPEPTKPGSLF